MRVLTILLLILLSACASFLTFQDPQATDMEKACAAAKDAQSALASGIPYVKDDAARKSLEGVKACVDGFVETCTE